MDSSKQRLEDDSRNRSVRWPFRILAAVLLVAVGLALLGGVYRFVKVPSFLGVMVIVTLLPLAVMMARTGGYVVWKGHVPDNLYWPFPSGLILFIWIGIFTLVTSQLSNAWQVV